MTMTARNMKRLIAVLSAGAVIGLGGTALGQDTSSLDNYSVYGITETATGNSLRRYRSDGTVELIDAIKTIQNTPVRGIQAAAYVPRSRRILSFAQDPDNTGDLRTKLVFIDLTTGQADFRDSDLGYGRVTGATAVLPDGSVGPADGDTTSVSDARDTDVYGVQAGYRMSGSVNINPSGSADNEFLLTTLGGDEITRDDLAAVTAADVDANGVYFDGMVTTIRVNPQTSGSQDGLTVDGQDFDFDNSESYRFVSAGMRVIIRNSGSLTSGGTLSMGHWHIDIVDEDSAVIYVAGDDDDPGSVTLERLVKIDSNGDVEEIMSLSRVYDSLAALDSTTFWATSGTEIWIITTAAGGSEDPMVGATVDDMKAMEFISDEMFGFSDPTDRLTSVDQADGTLGLGINLGMQDVRSIVGVRDADVPGIVAYD